MIRYSLFDVYCENREGFPIKGILRVTVQRLTGLKKTDGVD